MLNSPSLWVYAFLVSFYVSGLSTAAEKQARAFKWLEAVGVLLARAKDLAKTPATAIGSEAVRVRGPLWLV